MEFPTIIDWTNPFLIIGLLGKFQFHSNFKSLFCKQIVQIGSAVALW